MMCVGAANTSNIIATLVVGVRISHMLNSVDLFSGIGGITLGLKGIAKPLVYCDIESSCRDVLQARMASGDLPSARICPDVRILDKSWTRNKKVHLIVGGFPCVGFSALGLRGGFEDEQSGLFREVVRLVDVFEPPLVFMENVNTIVKMGLGEICKVFWEREYELRWVTLAAAAVGAPHERKRWFCLAVKRGFSLAKIRIEDCGPVATWVDNEPQRMVLFTENSYDDKIRCSMLGNAVVPDCVRAAFIHLVKRPATYGRAIKPTDVNRHIRRRKQDVDEGEVDEAEEGDASNSDTPSDEMANSGADAAIEYGIHMPTNGYTLDGQVFKTPPMFRPKRYQKNLCFDPEAFKTEKPPSIQLKAKRLVKPKMSRFWSTPRHGMLGACNYLTERSVRDLPTQVRFEKSTPDELRTGLINPVFVEWVMGYPPDWTYVKMA